MDGQIDQETKERRAELVMQIQTGIMAQKQAEKVGQTVRVLCDGIDEESGLYLCRTTGDAPEVDGNVCVSSEEPLYPASSMMCWWRTVTFTICTERLQNNKLEESV